MPYTIVGLDEVLRDLFPDGAGSAGLERTSPATPRCTRRMPPWPAGWAKTSRASDPARCANPERASVSSDEWH